MSSRPYTPLHVHTAYSILDGYAQIKDLADYSVELGLGSISISDHGSLGGAFQLYREASRVGIKPIIGLEAYESPDSASTRAPILWGTPDQKRDDVSSSGKYTHLTLFAQSAQGLRNLYQLYHSSFVDGFYGKPRVDRESLSRYSEGLVATSGCPSGAVQTLLRLGHHQRAKQRLREYLDIFGDRFYIEIMRHSIEIEERVEADLIRLSSELNIPLVATLDSHYVRPQDREGHDDLLCVQTRSLKSTPPEDRFSFQGDGYYLKSHKEFSQTFHDLPGAVRSTNEIADSVSSYDEVFESKWRFPAARFEAFQGKSLREVVGADRDRDQERLDYELSVIESRGFSDYLLVTADILNEGRRRGIRYGPGRGSASGSLVSYRLGITEVDPISNGLIFERFINPERQGFPDVDIDVDKFRRDEHIEMIRELYGQNHTALISTYGYVGARSSLRDSVRITGLPVSVGDDLCKLLPPSRFGREPELSEIKGHGGYPGVLATAGRIYGSIRSQGVHAAGVLISDEALPGLLPVHSPGGKGQLVTSYDGEEVEALGFLKTDYLGLATLGVIDECLRLLSPQQRPTSGPVVVYQLETELPTTFDDGPTYELLSAGETTGVFQLDSPGMRQLLRSLGPDSLTDIASVLALFRPGPMSAGAHTEYAKRKREATKIRAQRGQLPDMDRSAS